MQQFHSDPTPEADWDRLRPMLDDVMHALNGRDREAILLRFFEGRPFAEVGAKLGLNENSARMRVDRALDKLRALLARRGVTSTTAALSLLLANQAVVAAPASLAATVTTTAVAGVATATGGGVLAFLQLMSTTKTVAGLAGAMVIAIGTGVIVQQQTTARLREEVASLQQTKSGIAPLRAENQRLARAADEVKSLRSDRAELVQLRADVAVAKQKLAAAAKAPAVRNRNTSTNRNGVPDDNLNQGKETGMPKVIAQVRPVYPLGLSMDGETGEVTVSFIVDTNGDVQDASVLKSSDPDLSAAALAAVKQWKFSPGRRNGRLVKTRMQVPVIFNLADDPSSKP
jgi:TonB family protein